MIQARFWVYIRLEATRQNDQIFSKYNCIEGEKWKKIEEMHRKYRH